MEKKEFIIDNEKELIKAIIDELPFLSRWDIEKILKNKGVKVNNARVNKNLFVKQNDKIVVFYAKIDNNPWYKEIFKDENVLIVNKRAGIEVVSESDRDLIAVLKKDYDTSEIFPVHRIDRNTEGLVIFALNKMGEGCLLSAFKSRTEIVKNYTLMVHGRANLEKIKQTVYLKKMPNLSKVWISEVKTSGYDPVTTKFSVIEYQGENTLLNASLITGKTHQIRAHIAYYGYPILGDNKYGNDDEKILHLTASSMSFKFKKTSFLSYLNEKEFRISPTWL